MNPAAILALVSQVLAFVPVLVQAGASVASLIENARQVLNQVGAPGDPQWDALDAQCKALEDQFLKDAAPQPAPPAAP